MSRVTKTLNLVLTLLSLCYARIQVLLSLLRKYHCVRRVMDVAHSEATGFQELSEIELALEKCG
jgi:hypothetical protein